MSYHLGAPATLVFFEKFSSFPLPELHWGKAKAELQKGGGA